MCITQRFYLHIREAAKSAARAAVSKLDGSFLRQTPACPVAVDTLTNQSVLAMLESGLSAKIVVAKIRDSRQLFDTSTTAIKLPRSQSIPDSVIVELLQGKNRARQAAE